MENYSINPLFDFQILCDTDLGLYRLIKRDFYDRSIFNNYLFDSNDLKFIKTMIMCRDKVNPLHIFCKENVMTDEELDNLYEQFLTEEYDNILKLSPPTGIMSIASLSNSFDNVVYGTVLCKTEQEKQWIEKYDKNLKCIIGNLIGFDIKSYDTIYIKELYSLTVLKQESIRLKNIIFPKFLFNLEVGTHNVEIPLVEISKKYYKNNKFLIVNTYRDIEIPLG